MEQVRDLNMDTDDMLVVLSALEGVNRRIKEVAQTHKPLFGCISAPAPCRTIGTGGLFPTLSLQGRYSIRCRTWRKCWMRIIRNDILGKANFRIGIKPLPLESNIIM